MGKVLAIGALTLLAAACSRQAADPQPVCFPKQQDFTHLSGAEQKALNDRKLRVSSGCRRAHTQCGYSVITFPDKQIGVDVTFAAISGNPPQCIFMPGSDSLSIYSSSGNYVRTIPSL